MKKCFVSIMILILLSSCNLKGEKVWVRVIEKDNQILKVNALTKFTEENDYIVKAIVDIYKKNELSYDHSVVFHMISDQHVKSLTLNEEPLTLFTQNLTSQERLSLDKKDEEQTKKHILKFIKKLEKE